MIGRLGPHLGDLLVVEALPLAALPEDLDEALRHRCSCVYIYIYIHIYIYVYVNRH